MDLVDPFAIDGHPLAGRVTALYGPLTRRVPAVWGALYHVTNWRPMVGAVQETIGRGLRPRIRQLLQPEPALVVSFHPMLNHVASDVLPAGLSLVTVITDWISFHEAWTDRRASLVVCPSQAAYALCRQRGIAAERLAVTGLPIHPRFADALRRFPTRAATRMHLKLRPHAPTILLVGGGDGTEPLRRYARALARLPIDLQVLAVCGRNERLADRIRQDNHVGVRVFGFVDNMPELMLASDLLVTRAGPGMIAEGLACGCPLMLTGYLPGQESANVREVVAHRLGRYVARTAELTEAVTEWFGRPAADQEADRERARRAGEPQAAFLIADLLAERALSQSRPRHFGESGSRG